MGQPLPLRRVGHHRGQHLEQVVLEHVPDGPVGVVEPAPVGHVERLGHRDLDAVDVVPVQQRLDHRVGEPGEQHVLDRVQAQPVVDTVDVVLGEVLVHRGVQLLGAGQVVAERLLDHDPAPAGPARAGDALGDAPEQRRRDLQVEQHPLAGADLCGHGLVRRVVAQVPVDVTEQAEHLRRRRARRVHVAPLQRGGRVVAELLQAPAALGHPDHRDVKRPAPDQPHQRRKRLQLCQVAGCPEDHQRVGPVRRHQPSSCLAVSPILARCWPGGRRPWNPLTGPRRGPVPPRRSRPVRRTGEGRPWPAPAWSLRGSR